MRGGYAANAGVAGAISRSDLKSMWCVVMVAPFQRGHQPSDRMRLAGLDGTTGTCRGRVPVSPGCHAFADVCASRSPDWEPTRGIDGIAGFTEPAIAPCCLLRFRTGFGELTRSLLRSAMITVPLAFDDADRTATFLTGSHLQLRGGFGILLVLEIFQTSTGRGRHPGSRPTRASANCRSGRGRTGRSDPSPGSPGDPIQRPSN